MIIIMLSFLCGVELIIILCLVAALGRQCERIHELIIDAWEKQDNPQAVLDAVIDALADWSWCPNSITKGYETACTKQLSNDYTCVQCWLEWAESLVKK
jgi:hypothetical protein